ncbi:MAG TPA: histidine kinase dimerization/phospho-acceptor domain-containing protein [Candidatus Thermoplasmatota archaeon]|nr:histidine kinase dimerization/phospho-acceptor domain-containing protein [Candidatus Thermoplasmatota archaeon]
MDALSTRERPPSADERTHLEHAHHELRTALTSLRTNVELMRIRMRTPVPGATVGLVASHLTELDRAVERLEDLAKEMRAWHDRGANADD